MRSLSLKELKRLKVDLLLKKANGANEVWHYHSVVRRRTIKAVLEPAASKASKILIQNVKDQLARPDSLSELYSKCVFVCSNALF